MIKKFLKIDSKGRLFMDISDKIETTVTLQEENERHCPPHRIPHTLPIIGQRVTNEQCHFHTSPIRQYTHHEPFCKYLLNCPNFEFMKKARKIYKQTNT